MAHLIDDKEPLTIIYTRPLKRFFSCCIDMVIFTIFAFLLYSLVAYPIFSNMSSYNNADSKQKEAIHEMYDMYLDSKLAIYDEDNQSYSDTLALESQLSNKLNGVDLDETNKSNDIFYYFYVTYASENLSKDEVNYSFSGQYVNETFYQYGSETETTLWELQEDDVSLPLHLTSEAKSQINRYLADDIDQTSQSYYLAYNTQATAMMKEAGNLLLQSDQYQNAHLVYSKNFDYFLAHYSYASIITYTILFALYYVLIPLVAGDGKTLGKLLLGIGVYTEERHYVKKGQIIVRAILQYVTYFFLILFIPFLQIGMYVFSMPFLIFNNYVLTAIIPGLITFLLALTSFITLGNSRTVQSFHDKASHTIVGKIEEKVEDIVPIESKDAQ